MSLLSVWVTVDMATSSRKAEFLDKLKINQWKKYLFFKFKSDILNNEDSEG